MLQTAEGVLKHGYLKDIRNNPLNCQNMFPVFTKRIQVSVDVKLQILLSVEHLKYKM